MYADAAPLLDAPVLRRYGIPEYVKGAQPAAAAHFSEAVGGGYLTRLITVFCRLVTDATAANRAVAVEYLDPESSRFLIAGAPVTQPASTTTDYAWQAFVGQSDWTVDDTVLVTLPPLLLLPTMTWRIFVDNIQAGDQLSQVRYVRERFYPPDPVPGLPD